ncbi:ommochrome-binding protein-like [Phthorimaea operculella]|nr:ommochrome-binding protein-like [Phthorimaea operculella]
MLPVQAPVLIRGKSYTKRVILADANIPYKLSLDRNTNSLFFCINADEFSDQSFHSVILDINSGVTSVIPAIRNGFASAVDLATSTVYLGGSDGIYKYNYNTRSIEGTSLIGSIDIFDMYYHKHLYFVDTAYQNLYALREGNKNLISEVKGCLIHHFAFDKNDDLFFINSSGLFVLPRGAKSPVRQDNISGDLHFRGVTTDMYGWVHFVAHDGIYSFENRASLVKELQLNNGYGLAFDKGNNIIYSEERSITRLCPVKFSKKPQPIE